MVTFPPFPPATKPLSPATDEKYRTGDIARWAAMYGTSGPCSKGDTTLHCLRKIETLKAAKESVRDRLKRLAKQAQQAQEKHDKRPPLKAPPLTAAVAAAVASAGGEAEADRSATYGYPEYVGRGDDRSDVESVGNPADARESMAREGKEARHPVGRMEQGDKGGMLYGEMDAV